MKPVVVIAPGNGCNNIRKSNWYGELYNRLTEKGILCICKNFPDPLHARRENWIPYMKSLVDKNSSDGDNVILVGHSSGAQATLRYCEQYPVYGAVLVSATYSDLGDSLERQSGYYPENSSSGKPEDNPYLFSKMKENCQKWYQFHSDDDPFIPLHEAEAIRDGLGLTDSYIMLPGRSHFFRFEPELLDVILSLC
ncbi:serine hydrolase [Nitzschia inconspicua]|uniref:Serine hydrolase n=1 Tax=Nitzschia inconspicua TaxID=303405 RepID=A0A9K3LPW2_9STRA|nr:serine hydrolase [Nitzschia inconspicua]